MRLYELIFIVDPRLPEETREAVVEKTRDTIEQKAGGSVLNVDRWGIRKLAYKLPKSKLSEGDYTVILYRADGLRLTEVEQFFIVTPEVVRWQTVRREDLEKKERKQKQLGIPEEEVSEVENEEQTLEETPAQEESPEAFEPEFDVEEKVQ